jgi:hypothetical protein
MEYLYLCVLTAVGMALVCGVLAIIGGHEDKKATLTSK